jgi:putative transposase
MLWARMLAYITGTVDQELLRRNEYLAAENRILGAQVQGRLLLSDAEKATLAEIAYRLGRKALEGLVAAAKPDTLLAWFRMLIAHKFDGSKCVIKPEVVPQWRRKASCWWCGWRGKIPAGDDRIAGAMANLGYQLSDQTVGNILRRHDIPPAPQRKQTTSWKDFIRAHMAVLVATDFFTVEVLS